jgi:uncharacterized phage-associated protein
MASNFRFNEVKAIHVFVYIASRLKSPDIYTVLKILYLADVKHIANYGRPITGDVYYALQTGPVPQRLHDYFKLVRSGPLSNLHRIGKRNRLKKYFEAAGYLIYPKVDPDMDEFSTSDLRCLDSAIEENKDMPFGQLKQKTHDMAYYNASGDGKIDFSDIGKVGGVSEDMIAYIGESSLYSHYKPE